MKIVARVHLYPPAHYAGAEMMLHELLKALVENGHDAEVHLSRHCTSMTPYTRDGVQVFPRDTSDWQEAARAADVLVTHLDNTSTVISASIAYGKPLVQVLHNTHPPSRMWATCRNDLLVYNSDWMAREMGNHPNGIVVRPPVRVADYKVEPSMDETVTLINLSPAKGGVMLAQLAAIMPDVNFLGVTGAYGEQINPKLDNVEIRPHGCDMLNVYRDTAILIMPSAYESWGRTGVEAMCSGIPVIAADTPGLRESLGPAGVFMHQNDDCDAWAGAIRRLLNEPLLYNEVAARCRWRAMELDPTDELKNFVERVEALT